MGCRVLPEEPSGFKCFAWVAIYTFGGQRLSILATAQLQDCGIIR